VAKGVNGVVGVNNRISVDYPIERKDSEMQAEIEKGLEWNAYLDAGLIDVAVQDAEVSLSDVVGSYAEKRMARKDAWVHGVEAVQIDGLKVERWKRDPELVRHRLSAKMTRMWKRRCGMRFCMTRGWRRLRSIRRCRTAL